MKVALIGPVFPYRGGIAHYTALFARELRRTHSVRVYSFQRQYPTWLFPGRSQYEPSSTALVQLDVRPWLIPWQPLTWLRVQRDWVAWKPDAVIINWWTPFMALMTAGLLSLARRIPSQTLVLCHNVLPHERSWLDTTIARLALHSATNLIVHNPRNQAEAKSLFPNAKIRVVTHPTYAAFQSENWTRESARAAIGVNGQVILFFGLVRPYKGLLDLLEALSTLKSDITLLVVGEIWGNADTYQTYVKASGVSKFVRFVNRYVSNDEAAMFFAAVDLVVLPYREATGSGVLQLAFGLGVPVIATKVGGMEDAVDDGVTGFLVEPGDINGLAQAIQRFFAEDRAEAFRAAVQRQQMRFSWAAVVDAALSLVEQVDAFR